MTEAKGSLMEDTLQEALTKGVEMHMAGQLDLAKKLYASVLQLEPRHADANHNLGVIEIDTGNIKEAMPLLKIALEENPENAGYWKSSIDALIRLEDFDDARSMLNRAKERGATGKAFDQLEEWINQSDEKVYDTFLSKGTSVQIQLPTQDPLQEYLQPLINHYSQGQLHKALSEADQLLERFPNSVVLHDICGASNSGLRRFDAAIASYKKALKINPYYADAYLNIGAAQKEKGYLEDAIESYNQALKIKPDYAEAYSNISVILQDIGNFEAAITSCKQAIKLKPGYADAYYNMGIALQAKGDLETALESYKHALSFEPEYTEAYNNIGNVFMAQGNLDAAIEAYKHAVKINSDFAEAYNNMGNALKDHGSLDAAIDSYKQAIKINPDFAEVILQYWDRLRR